MNALPPGDRFEDKADHAREPAGRAPVVEVLSAEKVFQNGARGLAPLFARPGAWRALDAGVAVLTCSLGLRLIFGTV